MKRILWVMVLGSVASASAQESPPTYQPPYTTPPTFPRQQMPPDTKAPPPQRLSAAQVEQQIQDKLNSEPTLANTKVSVRTNDRSVTLTGAVNTEQQHALALRIARSYAGNRKIVDKIKVQERT
jgi:hypothetical protein